MGKFVVSTWARLLGITSASYVLWATLWAFYHRKFFWDFLGGELGPNGLVPSPRAGPVIKVIVDYPIVQLANLVLGVFLLALEWPVSFLVDTNLARSTKIRIALYLAGFPLAMLLYQTIDGGVFYLITGIVYCVSSIKGEAIERGTGQRGAKAAVIAEKT